MTVLTLLACEAHLVEHGALPRDVEFQFPREIACETLLTILSYFQTQQDLVVFVESLANSPLVNIRVGNKTISLGTKAQFIDAYLKSLHAEGIRYEKTHQQLLDYFKTCRWRQADHCYLFRNLHMFDIRDLLMAGIIFGYDELLTLSN